MCALVVCGSYRERGIVGTEVVPALVLQLLHHLVHRALQPRFHGDARLPQQVQTSLGFHLHSLKQTNKTLLTTRDDTGTSCNKSQYVLHLRDSTGLFFLILCVSSFISDDRFNPPGHGRHQSRTKQTRCEILKKNELRINNLYSETEFIPQWDAYTLSAEMIKTLLLIHCVMALTNNYLYFWLIWIIFSINQLIFWSRNHQKTLKNALS